MNFLRFPLLGICLLQFLAFVEYAQSTPAEEPAVIAIGKVLPAVVNINTERIVRRTIRDPFDDFFDDFFGGPMRPSRELRQKVQSLGSGFIVDKEGYIVTNEHVVERAADLKIQVTIADGKTYEAQYVAGDAEADLALIKIDDKHPFPYINLNDLSPNLLGQTLLVLGNPLGYGSSVSRGILSATNRSIAIGSLEFNNLLQTDAAINPGNSGGPVIDLDGHLVGISSVKLAYTPQGVPTQGLGFAIPANAIVKKIQEFRKLQSLQKGQPTAQATHSERCFGIQLQNLTPDISAVFGYQLTQGVIVTGVEKGSPAFRADLEKGTIILKVGEFEVLNVQQLEQLFETVDKGDQVDLEVVVLLKRLGRYRPQVTEISLVSR